MEMLGYTCWIVERLKGNDVYMTLTFTVKRMPGEV
jgi:hypothetical protein